MTKRLKLFSKEEPERMKLFSTQRRKLFSSEDNVEYNDPEGQVLRTVICKDCGHTMTTAETVTHMICPNCGGKKLRIQTLSLITLKKQRNRLSLLTKKDILYLKISLHHMRRN